MLLPSLHFAGFTTSSFAVINVSFCIIDNNNILNDVKCTELDWMCVPLAVESYDAWGVEACNAFSFLARREAIITNSPKSKVLCDLFGRP